MFDDLLSPLDDRGYYHLTEVPYELVPEDETDGFGNVIGTTYRPDAYLPDT